MRASLEVADIFRAAGPTYRANYAGHLSLQQLKVMAAIEACRTAALGGHVEGCEDCGHRRIAYNSCRDRHCPKCQGSAAREWLAARQADLLPVGYFHVVFSLRYGRRLRRRSIRHQEVAPPLTWAELSPAGSRQLRLAHPIGSSAIPSNIEAEQVKGSVTSLLCARLERLRGRRG